MNCSQCGHETPEGANACPNCGASARGNAQSAGAPPRLLVAAAPGRSTGMAAAGAAECRLRLRHQQIVPCRSASRGSPRSFCSSMLPLPAMVHVPNLRDRHRLSRPRRVRLLVDVLWSLILCLAVMAFLVARGRICGNALQLPISNDQLLLIAHRAQLRDRSPRIPSWRFVGTSRVRGSGFTRIGWGFGAFVGLIASPWSRSPRSAGRHPEADEQGLDA